jgi:hypothetical protein
MRRCEELIEEAVSARGGVVLKLRGERDSTMSVFSRDTRGGPPDISHIWLSRLTPRVRDGPPGPR